jgi:hypothetical protein
MRQYLSNNYNDSTNNKWALYSYGNILEEARQKGLLERTKYAFSRRVNVYTKEDTIFLITDDNKDDKDSFAIYYFSPDEENILGRGKRATVYAGKNLATGEDVAIKASHDEVVHSELKYTYQPRGWSLAKEKINGYEGFAKVLHYGCDYKTFGSNNNKYYLIMEKLELKPFTKNVNDTENIKDVAHLQQILNKAFAAITIMFKQGIYGIDWTGENLYLDAQGNPRFIDYDNWEQTNNERELMLQTNYSYGWLIPIIGMYYARLGIHSIPDIEYRRQVQNMQELISEQAFFEITSNLINMGEEKLAQKNTRVALANLRI